MPSVSVRIAIYELIDSTPLSSTSTAVSLNRVNKSMKTSMRIFFFSSFLSKGRGKCISCFSQDKILSRISGALTVS